jgi:4-alpha-glucanotransferase
MANPIRFVFAVHLHQPVGNFDSVFQQHLDEVYQPFLDRAEADEFLPLVLHLSGPLLEWLEQHGTAYLDRLGRLAQDGRVELLLAGMYEPVLAALPREDRVEQIHWLRDAIARRFGVTASGLWLTERVWEPELAADLADAGVRFALVDDRHFLVTGFERQQLHTHYLTESNGRRISLFPIDERLRYLIPFRPPHETAAHLRELAAAGQPLAVMADDGEKFGGWPGTREWVYERGWLDQFFTAIRELVQRGEVRLTTFGEALTAVPSGGLAYLPTASYREMELWALPPAPARRLRALEQSLGEERLAGPESAHLRGAHWRNFMVKYAEANRMHKVMTALSALCRAAGNPPAARRAIGRAQCNDAYWHGVFGGLYLPHLRHAIWRELAAAESELRARDQLSWEVRDLDADGADEIWIHGPRYGTVVAPARGGAVEVLLDFASGRNLADALTRRIESYHDLPMENEGAAILHPGTTPPVDPHVRALFVEWLAAEPPSVAGLEAGSQPMLHSWARTRLGAEVHREGDEVVVGLASPDGFGKSLRFAPDGAVEVRYRWDPVRAPAGFFVSELSLGHPAVVTAKPDSAPLVYPIETVAKSERGFDRTRQGECHTFCWPASEGQAALRLSPA